MGPWGVVFVEDGREDRPLVRPANLFSVKALGRPRGRPNALAEIRYGAAVRDSMTLWKNASPCSAPTLEGA